MLLLAAKAQTCMAFAHLLVTFAVGDESPFAMNNHWHALRTLARTMLMSKINRQCQNHRQTPFCFLLPSNGSVEMAVLGLTSKSEVLKIGDQIRKARAASPSARPDASASAPVYPCLRRADARGHGARNSPVRHHGDPLRFSFYDTFFYDPSLPRGRQSALSIPTV